MPNRRVPLPIQIAEGNRAHLTKAKMESIPKPSAIDFDRASALCPPDVRTNEEISWWRYYATKAIQLRVLTEPDVPMLARLVKTTVERIKLEKQLDKDPDGIVITKPSGHSALNPLWTAVSLVRDTELKLLREFGMSPTSRKIASVAPEPDNKKSLRDMLSTARPERQPVTQFPNPTPSTDAIQ